MNALAYGMTSTVRDNWGELKKEILKGNGCRAICGTSSLKDGGGSINKDDKEESETEVL